MPTAAVLDTIVRAERTRLIASLVRKFGFDLAEEAVDTAIASALEQWPTSGIPSSPRAWLSSVARRRAIDHVRHVRMADEAHGELAALTPSERPAETDEGAFPDDRLRLVFTCCHPAIAREAQVALALRWLSGLSTEDVARAFCVPVATMAQRLTRAKSKIETARIPYEVPERRELPARVATVLEVIYAIFNEGYVATTGDTLARTDLAEEAIHLARMLSSLLPEIVETQAMLALLLLVHARRDARLDAHGDLVPLDEQDRRLFHLDEIDEGKRLLEAALQAAPASTYAIEAAIQALHDEAPSFAATDFRQIVALYDLLRDRTENAVVAINRAVARAMVDGPAAALDELLAQAETLSLNGHPAYAAAKADLYRRLGQLDDAQIAYDQAIAATKNEAEQRFLRRRQRGLRG